MSPRPPARTFEDLLVWQKAHEWVLAAYGYSAGFPKSEIYGLSSQLRRAAVSIPANIAEGFRRQTRADKARFLNISQGSLEECRYYLILGQDLGYGNADAFMPLLEEVSRLLRAYSNALLRNSTAQPVAGKFRLAGF
jgi:four helix bundle protein